MGSECPSEYYQIQPKTTFLKAQELLLSRRKSEGGSLKVGSKKSQPNGSKKEAIEIQKLHDQLRKHLSHPRIEKISGRSVAEWDSESGRVKIIKKKGKFQSFGYTESKIHYLEYYEALFLMELNRLELYFQSVLVSIEQAYILLLGEEKCKNYHNYLIYSTFSRAGYIVQKYKNITYNVTITEEQCIWEFLLSSLEPSNHRTISYVKNSEQYRTVEKSLKLHTEKISKPHMYKSEIYRKSFSLDDYIDFDRKFPAKRKLDELFEKKPSQDCKKQRLERHNNDGRNSNSNSFLDILKNEQEYKEFQDIFEKFEIVQYQEEKEEEKEDDKKRKDNKERADKMEENCREMDINFDIYLPTETFRKSKPDPPALRAIVLGSNENFPNRFELFKSYKSQKYKVPLIVISVSDSKHIQAFLYYFT